MSARHEPENSTLGAFARHYIRDMVYAANDGLVTTFAVVAGVLGAGLSLRVVLVLGFANLAADGLSMALGNYLGIKSERAAEAREEQNAWTEREEALHAARHAAVTWAAFVAAGLLPLLPFLAPVPPRHAFATAAAVTLAALFTAGTLRTVVTGQRWWYGGLEMMGVGGLAGGAAFLAGLVVEQALK